MHVRCPVAVHIARAVAGVDVEDCQVQVRFEKLIVRCSGQ